MKDITLEVEAAIEYKGLIYFCEPQTNALYRVNVRTAKTEFLCFLHSEKRTQPYKSAYRYENYAWFIPWEAEEILCVNLDNLEMERYEIPYIKKNLRCKKKFPRFCYYYTSGRICEEKIFLVPSGTDTPVVINMKTKEIIAFKGVVDVEKEIMGYGVCVKDKIWMVPYEGDRILILDYQSGEVESIPWEFECMQYGGMLYHEDKIWFAPHKADNMLVFDLKTKKYDKILMDVYYNVNYSYFELCFYENNIWIVPFESKLILLYNSTSKEWRAFEKDSEICWGYNTGLRVIECRDKLVFATCRTGYVSIYDDESEQFNHIPVRISKEDILKKIENSREEIDVIAKTFRLEDYYGADMFLGLNIFLEICLRDGNLKERCSKKVCDE